MKQTKRNIQSKKKQKKKKKTKKSKKKKKNVGEKMQCILVGVELFVPISTTPSIRIGNLSKPVGSFTLVLIRIRIRE